MLPGSGPVAASPIAGLPLTWSTSGGLTLTQADIAAIAAAVRAELAAELARLDAPISDVPAEVLAAAQVAPIHADMRKVRGQTVQGSGTEGDPWGP